ncbi:hypothetical protein OG894_09940 [Streptomyces sp. NBC_01724]|uniref:hypothetical protein n=1 Tax=Streptomyces sp. NBC_01724 TaxID=2975922 RepID=UPI002E3158CD|nr:hypothetical protein [Streptomyces sp. NBC_01724]
MTDIYADTTSLPPRQFLPKALHKLLDARDAAYDKFVDFESEHAALLDSSWEVAALAQDESAGAAAMTAGTDPLDVPSKLEEAQRKRPKVIGALKVLASEVRRTDAALVAAVRRELPTIEAAAEPVIGSAADAYVAAQNAADAARHRYGASLLLRSWVTDWAKLGLRTDFQGGIAEASPRDAEGNPVTDIDGREGLRGAAEVNAIDESYGRVVAKPKAVIRSLTNGQEIEIQTDHAAHLVNTGQAEYVSGDAA